MESTILAGEKKANEFAIWTDKSKIKIRWRHEWYYQLTHWFAKGPECLLLHRCLFPSLCLGRIFSNTPWFVIQGWHSNLLAFHHLETSWSQAPQNALPASSKPKASSGQLFHPALLVSMFEGQGTRPILFSQKHKQHSLVHTACT